MKLLKSAYIESLGLKKHEKGAEEFAQTCLKNFAKNKNTNKTKIQKGGLVLPSDYFGVQGSGYVDTDNGTSTAPTAELLRPTIPSTFKPLLTGGSGCGSCSASTMQLGGCKVCQFKVSYAAFKSVQHEKVAKELFEVNKEKFEKLFHKAVVKAAKLSKKQGNPVLTKANLEQVVSSEKQFNRFL